MKTMLRFAFITILFFSSILVPLVSKAQTNELNEVFNLLSEEKTENARLKFKKIQNSNDETHLKKQAMYHYLKGKFAYIDDDYKAAINSFLLARQLYLSENNATMLARINSNLAQPYIEIGKLKEAEKNAIAAIDYFKKTGNEPQYISDMDKLGRVYLNAGDYLKAANIYMQTLQYYDTKGTIKEKGKANAQIGLAYDYAGLNDRAEHYYLAAIEYRKLAKDTIGLMNTYNNLGIVSKNTYRYFKAFQYYKNSYTLAVESKKEIYKINPLINMGVASRHMGNHKDAIKYYNEALIIAKKYNRENQINNINSNLATLYIHEKQYDLAYPLAKSSAEFAETSGNLEDKAKYLYVYASVLKGLNKSDEAFDILDKTRQYNDTLYKIKNTRAMAEISAKYETEKKQAQIDLLNQKNKLQELNIYNKNLELEKQNLTVSNQQLEIRNKNLSLLKKENDIKQKTLETTEQKQKIKVLNQQSIIKGLKIKQRTILLSISIGVILLGGLFTYLLINRRKLKAKAELQAEIIKQQDIASRAVLDAEERERRRIAGDLHDGVGQMLSAALMNLNGLFSKLNLPNGTNLQAEQALALVNESYDEMRSISHQMMPNALIKSGLASAVKEFIGKLDKDKLKVTLETVGLNERLDEQTETVIYRVIQETVNNVVKHAQASKLDIQIIKDEEGIAVTIEDNGKGFDKSKVDVKGGIGLSNIYSRVEFLKGTVDIDSTEGKGTLVAIHIP